MGILKVAWRNLFRHGRRTFVTVAAMTLALFVLILYTGLLEGYLQNMEGNILDLEVGDVQAHAGDYLDRPSIYTRIEEPEALLDSLERQGYRATARLLAGGLVAAGDSSAGASFRGVDVERDARVSKIHQHLSRGQWLDPAEPEGVVLGRRLAQTLDVETGDELVFLSQAADGSMANDLFEVRGVLLGVGDATDRAGIFLTAEAFREFFALADGAHEIILRRSEDQTLDELTRALDSAGRELDVKTWRELMPTMASLIDSTRSIVQIVFYVVYVVVAILVLNAMLMAVFERIREFGVMKAIGVSPTTVLSIIVVEAALQTGMAILIGLGLSVPGLWYLTSVGIDTGAMGGISLMGVAFNQIWYAIVTPYTFWGPVAALVVMVSLAVLYPAIKAARIGPLEAMRHQ
jgi:ABC-type lipoprotein release transport system permease subunit